MMSRTVVVPAVFTSIDPALGSRSGRTSPQHLWGDRRSASPMASSSAPRVRAPAFLTSPFTLENACSMGLMSGE